MKGKWLVLVTGTDCRFSGDEDACFKAQYEAASVLMDIAWGSEDKDFSRFIGYASKNKNQTIKYSFKLTKHTARRQEEIIELPFDEAVK